MAKAPAFQFYPKDWMDFKVQRLSLECMGAYINLLAFMWKDSDDHCSIVDNSKFISKVLSIGEKRWKKIRAELQHPDAKLFCEESGKLISDRLREEALSQQERKEKCEKSGKNGADKRWGAYSDPNSHPNGVPIKTPIGFDSSSSSSASSYYNTKVGKEPVGQKKESSEDPKPDQPDMSKNKLQAYSQKNAHADKFQEVLALLKSISQYRQKFFPGDRWSYQFLGKLEKKNYTDFPTLVEWLTIIDTGKDSTGKLYKLLDQDALYKLWNSVIISQNCSEKGNIKKHEAIKKEQPNMHLVGEVMMQAAAGGVN